MMSVQFCVGKIHICQVYFFGIYQSLELQNVCTCVLTVQAKVFGEGLSYKELKALRDKVADGPGVFIQTARGEALVGRVKEHKQISPLEKENAKVKR